MATIRSEQDAQDRALQAQKAALHSVVSDMGALRLIGKDADALEVDTLLEQEATAGSTLEAGEEREEGETDGGSQTPAAASPLNPDAKAFVSVPGKPNAQTRAQQRLGVGLGIGRPASAAGSDAPPKQASSPLPLSSLPTKPTGGDIEMGEVAEVKAKRRKPREEELEEGEATDASSELSDPPDDL
jgi:THO complex subunit 7